MAAWLGLYLYGALLFGYFSLVIPFTILDYLRPEWLIKYKIQPNKWPSNDLWKLSVKMVARNFAILLPLSFMGGFVLEKILPSYDDPVDDWTMFFLLKIPISFVLDDWCFYWYHRMLHTFPYLYKNFHKPHHVFTVPFAMATNATHPFEMMLQSVGGMMGPILFQFHFKQLWVWLIIRQWIGIEDHIGYELPFSPTKYFFAGSEFHDAHHSKNTGNYASAFSFYDDMFGTRISSKIKS